MIVLIIAGGSGTRLWPLSTPTYPKHLLKVNGNKSSLLQNTYKRAKLLSDKIYVVTEKSHSHFVQKQLPRLDKNKFIIEPSRKGTANCIVLALTKIEQAGQDPDEPIAILAADHHIDDMTSFKQVFLDAEKISQELKKIVLVGIKPTYAATGFGYIKLGSSKKINQKTTNQVYRVDSFKEKPKLELAKKYFNSEQYLWNGGYFIGSINTFKENFQNYNPDLLKTYRLLTDNQKNKKIYQSLDNNSIDYALIEKNKDLYVVPAGFNWLDLGSFRDLAMLIKEPLSDNNYLSGNIVVEEVKDSYIHNYQKKPLVVIGLNDVVVINTKDGLLITKKDLSQKVGDISKKL